MSRKNGLMIALAVLLVMGAVVGLMTIGADDAGMGTEAAGSHSGNARGVAGGGGHESMARPTRSRRDRSDEPARPTWGMVSTLSAVDATKQSGIWIHDALRAHDAGKRAAAVSAIEEALLGGDEASAYAALRAYVGIQNKMELDRGVFRDLVMPHLAARDPGMRRTAWYAFVHTDRQPGDRDFLKDLASDPAPEVKKSATHLMNLMEDGDLTGETGRLALGILMSDDMYVRIESMRGLSSARLSPQLEARIIELSRSGEPEEVQSAVQHVLGPMERKSPVLVDRLVELMSDTSTLKSADPAAQGLRKGVPEASFGTVADAAIGLLEQSRGRLMWGHGIDLLGRYGSEPHRPRIEALLDDQSLDDSARRSLQVVLQRLK